MLGCSTTCPKCQHAFSCCPPTPHCNTGCSLRAFSCTPAPSCCNARRSLHVLSGGGIAALTPTSPCLSPQVSPSIPLTFIIPSCPGPPLIPFQDTRPERELERLSDTVRVLRLSGWYYEGISYQRSQELLKDSKVGTFLVRDSSNPEFLYSLSVQTDRGPTSVRLYYSNGYFRLDAQSHLQHKMPLFQSVVELIQYYVQQSRMGQNRALGFIDPAGKWYSSIHIEQPLRKETNLKHLARLAVHKALQSSAKPKLPLLPAPHTQLELPSSLKAYLADYPYSV